MKGKIALKAVANELLEWTALLLGMGFFLWVWSTEYGAALIMVSLVVTVFIACVISSYRKGVRQ